MNRRRFLICGASIAITPTSARSQSIARTFKLGILFAGTFVSSEKYFHAFFDSLAGFDYVEGKNLIVERRFADGRIERLDMLARDLVAANMSILFAPPTPAVLALKKVTTTIPIVFCLAPDPVGTGLVKSLARPGGNATGISTFGSGLVAKRIELIRQFLPNGRRVGVLYDTREPSARSNRAAAHEAAKRAGLAIVEAEAHSRESIDAAFGLLKKGRADALLVFEGSLGLSNRDVVVSLAAAHHLPAIYAYPEMVIEGGLMAYTANTVQQYRRAAYYIDKILKGANPSDLPVEQPSQFELVINQRTAKSLGLTIPEQLLLRADRVIE